MNHAPTDRTVLLIGNFLSSHVGNYSVCEDLVGQLQSNGMHVLTASNRKARLPRLWDIVSTAWCYRRDYSMAAVDVYSGLGFALAEAACTTLRAAGKPFALTLRGGNLPVYSRRWPGRVRRLMDAAAAVTTPSRYLLESMRSFRDDIQLLPNPLQLDRYRYRLRDNPQPRLVWVRSFHRTYNPSLAVELIAQLVEEFPDVSLLMVGPDKGDGSWEATQQLAARLGVSERIEFSGGVPKTEIPNYLDRADIFVNTTNIDNTPVSVLEAMASGLCIVSTNVGGVPYLVDDRETGLLVPPRDVTALGNATREILHHPQLAGQLSAAARRFASQFDWGHVLPQWQQLIQSVSACPR